MRAAFLTLLLWGLSAVAFASQAAAESRLVGVAMDTTGAETLLRLRFDAAPELPQPRFIDKRRIVLDFASLDEALPGRPGTAGQEILPGEGIIRQLRYARRGDTGLRLVLDLGSDATVSGTKLEGDTYHMVVTGIGASAVAPTTATFEDGIPVPRLKPAHTPPRKPVIVVDAGHGGYDPGALGSKGTLEKDLTFSAANLLKKRLENTGRYDVVLTRDKDVYIAHEERLKTARLAGADLFISIHADSAGNSLARGASVYTLADRAVNRSRRLVESQNWIMDVDLGQQSDAVGDILVDLAQRKTASQSDQFADILIEKLGKRSPLVRNSHRRAGYFVLLAPDVPAVLLEMGFLSNTDDEANLRREKHRDALMRSTVEAIDAYFAD